MAIFGGLLKKTIWLSFLTVAVSTPLKRACVDDPSWSLTADNYKNSGADAWFESWRQGKTFTSSNNVFQQLVKEFVTGNHGISCPTAYGEILTIDAPPTVMNLKDENTLKAYFVLEAMVNVNSLINYFGSAVNEVVTSSILREYQMVTTFTQPVKNPSQNTDLGRRLYSAFSNALFFLGVFIAPINAPIVIIAGTFGQLSLGLPSPPSQADQTLSNLADYSAFVDTAFGTIRKNAADLIGTLFSGQADNNGNYIWDYVKDGAQMYSLDDHAYDRTTDLLMRVMTSGSINALWKNNHVYIVGSPTADCQNDNRAPKDVRFCFEDDNSHVYYMLMMQNKASDQSDWTHVQVSRPQGYDKLGSLKVPLSLQDAFRSSIATYKSSSFNYDTVRSQRLFNFMASGAFNQTDPNAIAAVEGVWSIPVCMDDSGMAISQVDSNDGINYPCICGPSGQDTGAFAASGSLMSNGVYGWWCGKQLDDRVIPN
ncbi:hypothetical protein BGZ63DRAFT_452188 [Mariannaea sp. PMI_226]|nr:hypothetical protein BGZ63DRAFT_452188 [Mariannaea sp. PMI_226]